MIGYIIGKISDIDKDHERKNRELAAQVGALLWDQGIYSIIPHLNDFDQFLGHGNHFTWEDFMRGDRELLKAASFAVVLPNYTESRGSLQEIAWCKEMNKTIYYWPNYPKHLRRNALLVLLSGKQGAGKTTVSNKVSNILSQVYLVNRIKFADKLYELHGTIRASMEEFLDFSKIDGLLLQLLGTEWGRARDPNIWVNIAHAKVVEFFNKTSPEPAIAIIDDARFENEFLIDQPNTLKVRLEASRETRKARAEKWRENEQHPSEIGLDKFAAEGRFDLYIDADELDADGVAKILVNVINDKLEDIQA